MEGWALAVAVLALLLSAFAFFKQFPLQRRVTDIEEARRQEEVASRLVADVTARTAKEPQHGSLAESTYLVIHNRGPSVAEDVNLETSGEGWHTFTDAATFPVTLDADQEYRVPLVLTVGSDSTMEVVLTWRDRTGDKTKRMRFTHP